MERCYYCGKEIENPEYHTLVFRVSKQVWQTSAKGMKQVTKKFVNTKTTPYCNAFCAESHQILLKIKP